MTGRRAFWLATAVAAVLGLVWLFWIRRAPVPDSAHADSSAAPARSNAKSLPPPATAAEPPLEGESRLADNLNAPVGNVRQDLKILNELFETWQSNFPRMGNPVGDNAEITAALSGTNPLRFAFLPRGHRAVNARGELCDRWGTPFRFHALSGDRMEICSAGPDRKFATADDANWAMESSVLR